jgi:hypothetical protein
MENHEESIKEETAELNEAELESVAGGIFSKTVIKEVGPLSPIVHIMLPLHT